MRYVFDTADERAILAELQRNLDKAETIYRTCVRKRKRKPAAMWARLADEVSGKMALLKGAFERKN
jgi:predicted dithiol-disulfide oxidoreductase (DUF899 family)